MNIAVDAGCLGIKDPRLQVGVYQVAKNLLRELARIDKSNKYFLYSFHPIEQSLLNEFGNRMENIVVRPSKGWMKIWLPLQLLFDKPDIFLALGQSMPLQFLMSSNTKTIGLIYDIAFEKFLENYPDSYSKLHKQTTTLVENASSLITISKTSRKDITDFYKIRDIDVHVLYPGCSKIFYEEKHPYSAGKPYFLYVGALKRGKNVPTIIRAFDIFLKNSNIDHDLFLVGGDKWFDPEIESSISALPQNVQKRIKKLGFIDDRNLVSLYKGATAFVSPSLYEGFGLPFVEAMSAGCPVIGSNRGSIPEVVGDAGILVEPTDVHALAEAMKSMAEDKKIRDTYIHKGYAKVKEYSWEKSAKETLAIIQSVGGIG